jgi:cobalt/nickel transport system permease protein
LALVSIAAGEAQRAAALAEKSYVSALAVLVVAGTTPVPRLLAGLESLGTPPFLLSVVQLLHRYLFVVSEQAQHMRLAARSRGSLSGARFRRWRLRAAAGAVAVLFARSYRRADGTYKAMLSRSFHGRLHLLKTPRLTWADALLIVLGVAAPLGLRALLVLVV